jgi:hypothetical protein
VGRNCEIRCCSSVMPSSPYDTTLTQR